MFDTFLQELPKRNLQWGRCRPFQGTSGPFLHGEVGESIERHVKPNAALLGGDALSLSETFRNGCCGRRSPVGREGCLLLTGGQSRRLRQVTAHSSRACTGNQVTMKRRTFEKLLWLRLDMDGCWGEARQLHDSKAEAGQGTVSTMDSGNLTVLGCSRYSSLDVSADPLGMFSLTDFERCFWLS